ncbi:DUF6455 family protein [Thalassovita sp.]|jgi:hypothetical protein|uniref:DUF6455 family protein n=1 Tax=Thalassovita sp. TaxID=1979401 RepID=UPI003B5B527C
MGALYPLGDPARHFWLTRSVARSMGLNFSDALREGRISPQGYSELVTQCRKCACVAQCEKWLAQAGISATQAPSHCPIAPVLNELKH